MTSYTSPDLLPAPSDYAAAADVPNAIDDLADATQVALNKKAAIVPTSGVLGSLASGWAANTDAYGGPTFQKAGRLVVCRGLVHRTAGGMAVTVNDSYRLGTIPAGFRPSHALRPAAAWFINGSGPRLIVTQLSVDPDGTLEVVSNVNDVLGTNSWVSLGGIAWVVP